MNKRNNTMEPHRKKDERNEVDDTMTRRSMKDGKWNNRDRWKKLTNGRQ